LRGTKLDIFGRTEERQQERELVLEYFQLVKELTETVTAKNLPMALELANLPDDIRGFGHVKEKSMRAAKAKRTALLDSYRRAAMLNRAA
jgi:indolepyruvate ferredoxin oxidoreductase